MRRNLAINFLHRDLPEAVPELLGLLGLWSQWDPVLREHVIWQQEIEPPRYGWTSRRFKGGSQEDWSVFLGKITIAGWKEVSI
jgi:hypothetical protein